MLDSALSVMSVLTRTGYLHRKKRPSAPTACEKRSGSSESATKERCSTALLFLWELQRIRIASDEEELLRLADSALYQSESAGRDRITTASV